MVRIRDTDRVRLAPADWVAIASLALAILTLVGATLYSVYDLAATSRERLARLEAELGHVKSDVRLLQNDVRTLALRSGP
ncbi:MAG: hypothetical protein ACRCT8_04435 [Lacipirellulaceae bacterium]